MGRIHVLSEETIDKIAAGEVVERPASIVKELIENSIDAGANAITIEIKEGGISYIRITDNGHGIYKDDIKTAFFRHATSKISEADDLDTVQSLGFRGEALSSIAAIAQVELLTKTDDSIIGSRYVIEGAKEIEFGDVGAPNGTTIIVRNIFFNTPVRRKFLKSPITEGSYVAEVCEHLALSRPDISIKFISGGQVKFHTSGSGDLKELIYRIYGKDIASEIIPINYEGREIGINGYLGKPVLNRSTRNYENYFINGRYVKSNHIAHAIEEGYKEYLMQHKFPFCILQITVNPLTVDVNVHPTKMEVRFSNPDTLTDIISSAISSTLKVREMMPDAILIEEKEEVAKISSSPEPFEEKRIQELAEETVKLNSMQRTISDTVSKLLSEQEQLASNDTSKVASDSNKDVNYDISAIRQIIGDAATKEASINAHPEKNIIKAENAVIVNTAVQMNLFEDKLLTKEAKDDYKIVGQIFDTYWIIEYKDKLLIMDQHAAHEKVKYEALIKAIRENTAQSQSLNPPIIVNLSPSEHVILEQYLNHFIAIGFEIDDFGGNDISLRGIPMDLFGKDPKSLFLEIIDELSQGTIKGVPEVINEKIASMACKSAVKGNNSMKIEEVNALIDELLTLDNPYNCPHGRPTIFTMSKYEIEKKFKRIV